MKGTNPFDDYFLETHGGTMKDIDDELVWDGECESDECVEDTDFNDPESF